MRLEILIATMILLVGCACEPIPTTNTTTTTMPLDVFTLGYQNELPVTTWEDTRILADEKFGSTTLWNCDGINMEFEGPPEGYPFPEKDGMYGNKWVDSEGEFVRYSVEIRCMLRIDNRTRTPILTFEFDPNDGKIEYLICNHNIYDNCPIDEEGRYIWIVYGRDMRK